LCTQGCAAGASGALSVHGGGEDLNALRNSVDLDAFCAKIIEVVQEEVHTTKAVSAVHVEVHTKKAVSAIHVEVHTTNDVSVVHEAVHTANNVSVVHEAVHTAKNVSVVHVETMATMTPPMNRREGLTCTISLYLHRYTAA